MRVFTRLHSGLRSLINRPDRDADLDGELRAFYEASVEAKVAAGMPREQAKRAARIELGSPAAVKDWVGDVAWTTRVEAVWRDVRHAVRMLVRSPGFTTAAVLILALGIGATTAIFSVIDAVILNPLPIAEPERVVSLHRQERALESRTFMYPGFERFREATASAFDRVSASGDDFPVRVSMAGGAYMASTAFVTGDYFDVVGVRPARGRFFVADEHQHGAAVVVVITDTFWRTHMDGDPDVVGQALTIADTPATIVGIAPHGFRGLELGSPVDLFLPLVSSGIVLPPGNYLYETTTLVDGQGYSAQHWLDITARLRPGVSIAQAEALLSTVELDPPSHPSRPSRTYRLVPASAAALPARTRGDTRRFAALLGTVVGLVLLLGCANLAGLLLARNEQRRRETAVRLALGARRGQVARLLLIEAAAVSVLGGLAALVAAAWMLQVIGTFVIPGGVRIETLQLGLTWKVFLVACAAAGFTAVTTGLLPAMSAARASLVSGLQARGGTATRARAFAGGMLVAAQVAISLVLIVGAALFTRSLQTALATDVGLDTRRLAYVTISFWGVGYDAPRRAAFARDLTQRLSNLPGVERATIGAVPFTAFPGSTVAFRIDGVDRQLPPTLVYRAGPDYFDTVGTPISSGRAFGRDDHTPGANPVVIVNETFARHTWPGEDPLGRSVFQRPRGPELIVVGVARDGKYLSLTESARPAIYAPWYLEHGSISETFSIRSARASTLVPAMEREVRRLDPALVIARRGTVEDRVAELAMTQRIGASLLGWFAALGLLLAAAGVYGLIAFAVARHTGEIGIRMALGARSEDVVTMMMRRSLLPVATGVTLGMAGAYALTRLTAGFLFGIEPHDRVSFLVGTVILVLGAALASYCPARRAARVDPVVALRAE